MVSLSPRWWICSSQSVQQATNVSPKPPWDIVEESPLCDRDRCLRYSAPELRVMAEKDVRPAPF
jgi:hypothetical protein